MTTTVPCRAQDPNTCPYHGNLIKADAATARADAAVAAGDLEGFITARDEAADYQQRATTAAATTPEVSAFFGARATTALTVPTAGSPYQPVNYLPRGALLMPKVVTTQAQLRQAVLGGGGTRGRGTIRQVVAAMPAKNMFRKRTDPETVVEGPADGRPIVVELENCYTDLRVASGTALINATSTSGGSVKVNNDAVATVITPPGKIHIDASGDSRVTIVPRPGARGSIWVGSDAEATIVDIPGVQHSLEIHRGNRRDL